MTSAAYEYLDGNTVIRQEVPQETLWIADSVQQALPPVDSTKPYADIEYAAALEGQTNGVLCELLRRGVPFVGHELIRRNYHFMHTQARAILTTGERRGLEPDDLVAGAIGPYLAACRRYTDDEYKLTTYTGRSTWYAMQRVVRKESYVVNVPIFNNRQRYTEADIRRGRRMTVYMGSFMGVISAYDGKDTEDTYTFERQVRPLSGSLEERDTQEMAMQHMMQLSVADMLSSVSPREVAILRARYGFDGPGESDRKIGEYWGLSGPGVQKIATRALKLLARKYPEMVEFLRD
jgi:DNA-directed RNA polymerase sigma subunit (sigma70/sigma32)